MSGNGGLKGAAAPNLAGFRKSVLVVDDLDNMRKDVARILREAGIPNVVEANEGGRAFQLLTAAPEVYGLIISDLEMDPMNGLHLLSLIRTDSLTPEIVRDIPFIMMTGDLRSSLISEIRTAGAQAVVAKPFNAVTLRNTVKAVLEGRPVADPLPPGASAPIKTIVWRDVMSVGDSAIDEDHKQFIALVNIAGLCLTQRNYRSLGTLIGKLGTYADIHFSHEERIMEAVGYAEIDKHRAQHAAFRAKLKLIADRFSTVSQEADKEKIAMALFGLVNGYLVEHMIREDIKLKTITAQAQAVISERPMAEINAASDELARKRREVREKDVVYELPPKLAHLLKRLDYIQPTMPPPESRFDNFEALCEAAILRRVDKVLVFFHRYNPDIVLELPPPFLMSPLFMDKFHQAVRKFIFPPLWESRQIRLMATNFDMKEVDSENFWDKLTDLLKETILSSWENAWNELKLVEQVRPDGSRALLIKENTKALRALLDPGPEAPYDLPKVGNREIDVFKSLLDTKIDWWRSLNNSWKIIYDLYEQERSPRIFQQKAREGALRDSLLHAFAQFPDKWVDFMVLATHRVFSRVTTGFIEKFTTNLGSTEAAREAYLPYTIRYLRQARENPRIAEREREQDTIYEIQMTELRKYLKGQVIDDAGDVKASPG